MLSSGFQMPVSKLASLKLHVELCENTTFWPLYLEYSDSEVQHKHRDLFKKSPNWYTFWKIASTFL